MKKPVKKVKKENRQSFISLIFIICLILGGVMVFLKFYNTYNDRILYAERLSQMKEVTIQLFSGLEDVVKNEWKEAENQSLRILNENPETLDDAIQAMQQEEKLGQLESANTKLIAVDDKGNYYTQDGRKGLLNEKSYLLSKPERISFVSNFLFSDDTRMIYLTLQDGDDQIVLEYYGISQSMTELSPYFECTAYNGSNSMYVVDSDGLKLFGSSSDDLIKGYNVYSVLDKMDYLHGSSFASAKKELEENNISYSNAVISDEEVYYAMYHMENAQWTLIFMVPSKYVATNTVDLVNTTTYMVLAFAVIMIVVSGGLIFWILKKQQKMAVEAERRNNQTLEKLNRELEKAVKEADAANKAKSDFLANMSHDIRTPMNAIVGITNLMEREESTSDKLHTYIQKVQLSSRHLLSLINDILDMSKIESSEVALNQEAISLAEQIGQVDSIIRSQTNERGQTLNIRVHTVAHEYLIGDSVRLRQILINLLSNAVKYTPYGGTIDFDIAEVPCSLAEHASFHISVRDNGYGMAPEFVEHIFEPFTREESSMTNKVQGTGLGMAITKSIVDLMEGTINVQSEPDKGTCFNVELTFLIDRDIEIETIAQGILLISDEDVLIRNMEASIQEANIPFYTARTTDKAVEALRGGKIDVILIAGHLHDQTLPETVKLLRQSAGNALLIFCCDYAQQEQVYDILKNSGVDGLISRPFFLSNLSRAVCRIFGSTDQTVEERGSVLKRMKFLCAEDNELNAEILEAVLDMNGAECVIYPNGKQLVEAFASVKPGDYDAILMDIQMPVMNGLEASRAIRSSENPFGRDIPIIAMTANAFTEDIQKCLDAGMDAHVAKPLDVAVLERTLQSILAGGQMLRWKKRKSI